MVRIGLLCPYSLSVPGGVQNQVMSLARTLRERGHEARVLGPCDGPPPAAFVSPLGASVRQPTNGSVAPIAPDPAAQLRTMRALWDEDFDVLHLHEPLVPGPTLTALMLGPAPVVGTFHAAGAQPAYVYLAPLVRWASRGFSAKVVVSPDARQLIEPYVDGPFVELFNGIETKPLGSAEPWPTEGPTVFFLGRHEPRKGLDVLLESVPRLPPDARVWVAGEGDATAELRSRHRDPRIEWLGRVGDEERDRRLAGADVFCAPSLGGESFGIILLEAMAAGTPVVASEIPGYANVAGARAAEGGGPAEPAAVLVPPGDAPALGRALASVLGDPALAADLRRRGQQRATAYDMGALCDRYEEIYAGVVAAAGPH